MARPLGVATACPCGERRLGAGLDVADGNPAGAGLASLTPVDGRALQSAQEDGLTGPPFSFARRPALFF
jgi:hypothetical protein